MQIVAAERQTAEEAKLLKRQREQALQEQASAWQGEMDRQATASAAAMRQWKKQNGFGARVRRLFTGVLQAGIGSFTSGLVGTVTSNLANKAAQDLFGSDAPPPPPGYGPGGYGPGGPYGPGQQPYQQ